MASEFEELNELIKKCVELRSKISNLTAEKDFVDGQIKYHLEQMKLNKYDDPTGNTVSYSSSIRNSFNSKAFKESVSEEEYNKFLRQTTVTSLRVLTPEDKERVKRFA